MHLFLNDYVVFKDFIEEDYPQIQKQRKAFLKGLNEQSGYYHIIYSDFYPSKKLRFAMGVSQPLTESETLICIDQNIYYQVFEFQNLDELDRLWIDILQKQSMSKKRAYLIDYEVHHGDGSGELYLSVLED